MAQGYEVEDGKGGRAWWDGKKLTPMNEAGFTVAGPGRTTEGERTAGFLAKRAADSTKNLVTIGARSPEANKPNLFEAAATTINQPGIANALRSGDRQQVYANQLDLLDAALTLGTGAAYTKEQLNNYRDTYFPGLTDKPETVKAKRQKLLSLLEGAKIKAGGAAPAALDEAINQMRGPQGASMENPFALTEQNRSAIPEGSYFKAGDGKTYRQKKGAGFPKAQAREGKTGASGMSDDEIKRTLRL